MARDRRSSGKPRRGAGPETPGKARGTSERRPPKRPTNLTLDPQAVARGERFGKRHGTSLSQLVNRFLHALPDQEVAGETPGLSPAVRRLYGVAAGAQIDRAVYRQHLLEKYGSTD